MSLLALRRDIDRSSIDALKSRSESRLSSITSLTSSIANNHKQSKVRAHQSEWLAECERLRKLSRALTVDVHRAVSQFDDLSDELDKSAIAQQEFASTLSVPLNRCAGLLSTINNTGGCASDRESLAQLIQGVKIQHSKFHSLLLSQQSALEKELRPLTSHWIQGMESGGSESEKSPFHWTPPAFCAADVANTDRSLATLLETARCDWLIHIQSKLSQHEAQYHESLAAVDNEIAMLKSTTSAAESKDSKFTVRAAAIYREYSQKGHTLPSMTDRLKLEFPRLTQSTIHIALQRMETKRFLNDKRRTFTAETRRTVSDCIQQALAHWHSVQSRIVHDHQQSLVREEESRLQQQRLDMLSELRQQRAELDRAKAERQQIEQLHDEAEAKIRAQREFEYRTECKQQLRQYESELQRQLEKVSLIQQVEKARKEVEQNQQSLINQTRVLFRQSLLREREEQDQQLQRQREESQRELEQRLESLRATVRIEAERDAARLVQPTAASAAEHVRIAPLFSNPGFNEDGIFADPRARLSSALFAAGLAATSEAAKEALLNTKPLKTERRDLKSSVFGE